MGNNLLYFLSVLLVLPTNSYVIWLIVSGKRIGLAAEFFSLNLAVCEILLCVESVFIFLSYEIEFLWTVVSAFDGLASIGHPLFQCLICVERYLAVVHPVTFLKFKPLRYREICSVNVWVASFGSSGIFIFFTMFRPMLYLVFFFCLHSCSSSPSSCFVLWLFSELWGSQDQVREGKRERRKTTWRAEHFISF